MEIKGIKDTIDWYNQNAEDYARATLGTASIEEIDDFVKNLPRGAKVLDAGCGSGRDTSLLKLRGLDPVGLDISGGLLRVAQKQFPGLCFIEGNMLKLPFPDTVFNGVWAHASLLHFETTDDVNTALSEFNRVLKKSGVVHVLVKAQKGAEKTAVVSDALSKHDRFFQYFTVEEIEGMLGKNGFEILQTEKYRESDKNPKGRPEVEWILVLARKTR